MKNKPIERSNSKIKTYVDLLFDDIPYSEEVTEAQSKIEAALSSEFDRAKTDRHEDEALEELLAKYGKLSKMAELAGYPADSADKWRQQDEAVNIRPLKQEILKQRRCVYITALFATLALTQIFWLVYNAITRPSAIIGTLIVIAAQLLIIFMPFRKYLRTEKMQRERNTIQQLMITSVVSPTGTPNVCSTA